MIWVDYCILAVILVSTLVGVFRGFTRETLSLLTWAAAIWLAVRFGHPFAHRLAQWIAVPSIRLAVAYGALFFGGLLVGAVISHILTRAVRRTPLSGPDRTLGAGFGMVRGLALIVLFVMLAQLTPLSHDPWWHRSLLIARFEPPAAWVHERLPSHWIEPLKADSRQVLAKAAQQRGE